ncbi:DUF6355 family natural product biosynthesis protein [Kibdelosporangium aridum]|uniref:DUF6355 family natural product biosynthesis protein n=1 Tax=Kibdelosporangium aridum TaxID=2030 RepID=UPI00052471BD|nr:DUF6355 family natural product biosynthesis protein [Kibdelosporangium aridum]
MKFGRKLAAGAVVLATTIAPFAVTTSAAAADDAPCGFYTGINAYYNHCGDNYVTIKVDHWDDRNEWSYCSAPWEDKYLGPTNVVSFAHFAKAGC